MDRSLGVQHRAESESPLDVWTGWWVPCKRTVAGDGAHPATVLDRECTCQTKMKRRRGLLEKKNETAGMPGSFWDPGKDSNGEWERR